MGLAAPPRVISRFTSVKYYAEKGHCSIINMSRLKGSLWRMELAGIMQLTQPRRWVHTKNGLFRAGTLRPKMAL
jgi:hypothetical protein